MKSIILGCTGQIGSYFVDYLLNLGHEVYGVARRVSTPNYKNIMHNLDNPNFYIEEGDVTDLSSLIRIFDKVKPDFIIDEAAQSQVGVSFNQPLLTIETTGVGAINVFEAMRKCCPDAKTYFAGTSELFDGLTYPQNENTPFRPKSPYGVAKLLGVEAARVYYESYGLFICAGIQYNTESPRRGIEFVTQKIVDTVVRQVCGEDITLELGNLSTKRDWQHAKDAVKGQWLMLQQDEPKTYILATGKTHSIYEFVNKVYQYFDIDLIWIPGKEYYNDKSLPIGLDSDGKVLVKSVSKYMRPNEVAILQGDSSKARTELGWNPQYTLDDIIKDMIESKLTEYGL